MTRDLGLTRRSVTSTLLATRTQLWWLVPILIAGLLSPLSSVKTSSDSAWYLSMAMKLHAEHRYVDAAGEPVMSRGPVFPALLSGAFAVFGASVKHAFWVVRAFYVLLVGSVLIMGLRFFGRGVAFFASLLVLSSATIGESSSQLLLDGVFPVFVLASLCLLYIALRSQRLWLWAAGGVAIGVAFLTKEMALLYVPFPFLLWCLVFRFRTKRNVLGLAIYSGAFAVVLVPWAVHVFLHSGSLAPLIGGGGPKVLSAFAEGSGGGGVGFALKRVAKWVADYYTLYLADNFALAPLMAAGWGYTTVRFLVTKAPGAAALLTAGVLFLPIVAFQGGAGWRVGQGILFFVLSLVAAAYLIVDLWRTVLPQLVRRWRKRVWMKRIQVGLALASACAVLGIQASADRDVLGELTGSTLAVYSGVEWTTTGWHTPLLEEVGMWLRGNVSAEEQIMCDWYWRDSLSFYYGNLSVHGVPYVVFPPERATLRQQGIVPSGTQRPLFLWVNRGDRRISGYLHALREGDLLRAIEQQRVRYVVTTLRRGFLCLYFSSHPGFARVADWGDVVIFEARTVEPVPTFEMHVGDTVPIYLLRLARQAPADLEALQTEFFERVLSLNVADVKAIVRGDFPFVEIHRAYCSGASG